MAKRQRVASLSSLSLDETRYKELLTKLAATKGGGGPVRYATPVAPSSATEGFAEVANNLLRGLFSKSEAPHSQPPASNIYVGSAPASNWPL